MTTQLIIDNVYTSVIGPTAVHKLIKASLLYQIKNHKIIARKKVRMATTAQQRQYWNSWDGFTTKFYDIRVKKFLTGLLSRILHTLQKNGVAYELIDKRKQLSTIEIPPIIRLEGGIELRDYQHQFVSDFIKAKRGVAKMATGGGKTECAIATCKLLELPTLFLTHRVDLLNQTAQRFVDRLPARYKNKIGVIGGGNSIWEPLKPITIATVQTIQSAIKKHPKETAEVLSQFEFLVIDEAHRSGSNQFHQSANLCVNAQYRMALTATPFMKGNAEDDLQLLGVSGNIVSEVTNAELIERGILAKPFFKFYDINSPADIQWLTNWRDIYEKGIVHNEMRNELIVSQTSEFVKMGKKALTIVVERKHGLILFDLMKKKNLRVEYVDGKSTTQERKSALNKITKNKLDVVIATNIFDEGIDVNAISALILAAGQKSPIGLFQRIGRSTRKKQKDNYAIIVDFIDRQHEKLLAHSSERYNFIHREKGFVIL